MQKVLVDNGLLASPKVYDAGSKAIAGWLFLLGHCALTKNGGKLPVSTSFERILPTGVSMSDVSKGGLISRSGEFWEVFGYDARAELEHTAKVQGGLETARKRWGGKSANSSATKSPKGSANSSSPYIHTSIHSSLGSSVSGGDAEPIRDTEVDSLDDSSDMF